MQRRFNDVIFHKTLKSAVVLLASNPYLKDKNYTTVNLDFTLYVRSYSTQGTVTVSSRYGHGQPEVLSRSEFGYSIHTERFCGTQSAVHFALNTCMFRKLIKTYLAVITLLLVRYCFEEYSCSLERPVTWAWPLEWMDAFNNAGKIYCP